MIFYGKNPRLSTTDKFINNTAHKPIHSVQTPIVTKINLKKFLQSSSGALKKLAQKSLVIYNYVVC